MLDRGDAADLMDVVRHELGLSKREKRFPRKDTCLAIYSHRVNTQGALADTLRAASSLVRGVGGGADAPVPRLRGAQARQPGARLRRPAALLARDDGRTPRSPRRSARSSTTCWWTSTRTPTRCRREILRALRPRGAGVTVVGDDAQAIYSFRAATVENILGFPAQFAPRGAASSRSRTTTARRKPMLDAANALIAEAARQYRKTLRATRGAGERPRYVTVADDQAQADYVVDARAARRASAASRCKRQAVLFRSSHHSDVLELELVRRNIPYVKYGGLKFLEAAHVKDLLAVLRWADNPQEPRRGLSRAAAAARRRARRTPRAVSTQFEAAGHDWRALAAFDAPPLAAGAGPRSRELLARWRSPTAPWAGQVARVREWYEPHLERIYEARARARGRPASSSSASRSSSPRASTSSPSWRSIRRRRPATRRRAATWTRTTWSSPPCTRRRARSGMRSTCSTSPTGISRRSSRPASEQIEEERRLLYVAMTRAKTDLHLIAPLRYYVTQQRAGDRHVYGARSRFMTRGAGAVSGRSAWPAAETGDVARSAASASVDVAAKLGGCGPRARAQPGCRASAPYRHFSSTPSAPTLRRSQETASAVTPYGTTPLPSLKKGDQGGFVFSWRLRVNPHCPPGTPPGRAASLRQIQTASRADCRRCRDASLATTPRTRRCAAKLEAIPRFGRDSY